jgi:methylmalonyl-CoA mutase
MMSELHNKPNLDQQINQIVQELKGKPYDSLSFSSKYGITMDPIYSEGLEAVSVSPMLPYRLNFQLLYLNCNDLTALNHEILDALQNGISGLILDFENTNLDKADLQQLFKDVELTYLHIVIQKNPDPTCFIDYLKEFHPTIDPKTICIDGHQSFSRTISISEEHFAEDCAVILRMAQSESIRLFIFIELSGDYFWDISKIRAFKTLLSNTMAKMDNGSSAILIGDCFNSESNAVSKENNLIGLTTKAMAALVACCDGLWIQNKVNQNEMPSLFDQRISRNVFNILKEESYLDYVHDAGSGSYFIENYTKKIAQIIYDKL